MEQNCDKDLIKFRALFRKQDKSACLSFLPRQFFFANHEMPLLPSSQISVCQSNKNKLCLCMVFAGDPIVGYKDTRMMISLSQVQQIRLVEDNNGKPPAIIVTLQEDGIKKVNDLLPGLKRHVEGSVHGARGYVKDMMFFLDVFEGQQRSGHIRYQYTDNGHIVCHSIDFDEAKTIFMRDIVDVHEQYRKEWVAQRKGTNAIRDEEFIREVDSDEFYYELPNRGIERNPSCRFNFRRDKNFRFRKHIPINCEEYSKGDRAGISVDKKNPQDVKESQREYYNVRKRKMDAHIAKTVRWRNREGWVPSQWNKKSPMNNQTNEDAMMHERYMMQTNCENEEMFFKQKDFENQLMYGDAVLQHNNNSFNGNHQAASYSNGNDITAVTEGMSHIEMNPLVHSNQMYAYQTAQYEMGINPQQYFQPEASVYDLSSSAGLDQSKLSQGDNAGSVSSTQRESKSSSPPAKATALGEDKVCTFTFPDSKLDVFTKDVKTLDRKEFVNDIVMDFMANYIYHFRIGEKLKQKVHFFATFFYTNISKKLPSLCFSQRRPINPEHEALLRLDSVLRWTRKFDVLKKDYIIIPLNEDLHWMLIVVVNPSGAIVDMSREKKSRSAPKTYMLFFDPLSGLDPSRCNHMCHCVKLWLRAAYQEFKMPGKKYALGKNMIFDESRIEVIRPKNMPIQNNFYDCGLYVLHYIEGVFCSPAGPIVLKDLPHLDWAEKWPEAEKMSDLMRDKVYNLIVHFCDEEGRSRLSHFERITRTGLAREKELRKSRRHSAAQFRRTPRHPDYYGRHYSLNPSARNIMAEDPTFANPRGFALMPLTQRVRRLRMPEENFPIAY